MLGVNEVVGYGTIFGQDLGGITEAPLGWSGGGTFKRGEYLVRT